MLKKTMELFKTDGTIFEIRALNCWDRNPEYTCTRTGYFNDLDAAVRAVEDLEKHWHPEGVYLTLNPVLPDLLGRASNRLRKGKKEESTKDHEITCRRWILFDFDPKRPAGISSTDGELADAQEQCRLCACWLRDHGWPLPVVAMSGNGWHLLYRVDLPTEDNDLLKRCLASTADRFSTPSVSVDQKVFNASRITKLYGTLARKGDATPDRPHRRSQIVEIPETVETVGFDRLEWLAGPKEERKESTDGDSLRVEHWLQRHNVQILNTEIKDGTSVWYIPCPNLSSHGSKNADTDCCITQEPSGLMGGHCFHDSCGMKSWQDLKNAIGPLEYDDYHEDEDNGVDISRLPIFKTEADAVSVCEKLPPFPQELMNCGGILERIIDYNLRTAIYPMPELALAGALALMSLITGRKVEDRWELRTNAYFLGLADAGSGKNHSRQVNNKILAALKKTDLLGPSKLKSSSGLISALEEHPASLFQIDEMSRLLQTMRDPRNAPHLYDIGTVMLEAYSESANPAWKAGAYADRKKNPCVEYPHLVLYGVAVSAEFWQSLTKSNLTDGLLGRLMPFENRERIASRDPTKSAPDETMLTEVAAWLDYTPQQKLIEKIKPTCSRIHHTVDAWERYQQHFKAIEKSRPGESDTAYSIWKRTGEKTGKLAMLSACSRVPPMFGAWPVVELKDVDWAVKLSNWLTRSVLIKAGLYVSETPHEQNLIRLLRELENWKSKSKLCRDMRWLRAKDREDLLKNAILDGYVIERKVGSDGPKPITEYRRAGQISL